MTMPASARSVRVRYATAGVGIGPSRRHVDAGRRRVPPRARTRTCSRISRVSLPIRISRRPLRAKTRPAAQPSRKQKSGVIGASPTRPRMPSVPKYFLVMSVSMMLGTASSTHPPLPPRRARARSAHRSVPPPPPRRDCPLHAHRPGAPGDRTNHAFPRQTDQQRHNRDAASSASRRNNVRLCSQRLSEAEARIDDDPFATDSGARTHRAARSRRKPSLPRRHRHTGVHSASSVAHLACASGTPPRQKPPPTRSTPGSVSARTSLIRCAPASSAARATVGLLVSTETMVSDRHESLHDRDHTPQFFVCVDRCCARSRRFAADVDERGAVVHHLRRRDRRIDIGMSRRAEIGRRRKTSRASY